MVKSRIGFSIILILAFCRAANAAKHPLIKTYDDYGNENWTSRKSMQECCQVSKHTGWYAGLNGAMNFVSWTYNASGTKSETHSGSQIDGSIFIGGHMSRNWRGEIALGASGTYTDKSTFNNNDGLYFSERAYFAMFNAIYEIPQKSWSGFYVGAGAGLALVDTEFNDTQNASANAFSPMAQVLFGYETDITDSVSANIGFKGGAYYGGRVDYLSQATRFGLGIVWNAGATIGLRYKF